MTTYNTTKMVFNVKDQKQLKNILNVLLHMGQPIEFFLKEKELSQVNKMTTLWTFTKGALKFMNKERKHKNWNKKKNRQSSYQAVKLGLFKHKAIHPGYKNRIYKLVPSAHDPKKLSENNNGFILCENLSGDLRYMHPYNIVEFETNNIIYKVKPVNGVCV